jgi:SAM-dependent methyltransferase
MSRKIDKTRRSYTVNEMNYIVEKKLKFGNYQHVVCNLCGSDDAVFYAIAQDPDRLHIKRVRCRHCGFTYSNPQATADMLAKFYDVCYKDGDVAIIVRSRENEITNYRNFFALLGRRISVGRFLDVGCSTGHILNIAREFGWDTYGVDISPSVVRYARQVLKLDNVQKTDLFRARYPDNFFDFVFLSHVLEHVSDPTALLLEINRILRPGGGLRVAVPCIKDPMYYTFRIANQLRGRLPGMSSDSAHTCEFTPYTLRKILIKAHLVESRMSLYYNPIESLLLGKGWRRKIVVYFWWHIAKIIPNRFGHRLEMDVVKRQRE